MNQQCKIVMYHYVRPLKSSSYPGIKGLEVNGFIRQLEYFKKKFTFITAEDLLNAIYCDKQIPDNSILLTFDDGLKDHYLHVFPILKKAKIQGLFFPTGKPIVENVVLDVHKIHFILATCNDVKLLINHIFSFIEKNRKNHNLKDPMEYFNELAFSNRFDTKEIIFIKRILQRELPEKLREQLVDDLFKEFVTKNEKNFSRELYLSNDEITEMSEEGMYFGSHTYSHYWLGHLSPIELDSELKRSTDFYSKINVNKEKWIMCYPYGNYNQDTISIISRYGFKAGLTTEVGNAIVNTQNSFILKRLDTNDFPQ